MITLSLTQVRLNPPPLANQAIACRLVISSFAKFCKNCNKPLTELKDR